MSNRDFTVECEFCYGNIYPSEKGIANLLDGYAHKKCVVECCNMLCPECGLLYDEASERCEFDRVELKMITRQEAHKIIYSRKRKNKSGESEKEQ